MGPSYQAYDEVLDLLYRAPGLEEGLGPFLLKLEGILEADMASVTVYDDSSLYASHGVTTNHHPISPRRIAAWQHDAAMRRLTHRPFPEPVRLSDLAPQDRLTGQAWYQAQFVPFGLKYCVFQDVNLGPGKIRMLAQRGAQRGDFDETALEIFRRVGRHVGHAAPLLRGAAFVNAARSGRAQVFDLYDRLGLGAGGQGEPDPLQRRHGLTPAEARVAHAFARGEALRTVAERLGLSVNTVKVHLRHIYAKLGVQRLPELVSVLAGLETAAQSHPGSVATN